MSATLKDMLGQIANTIQSAIDDGCYVNPNWIWDIIEVSERYWSDETTDRLHEVMQEAFGQ